mmetsp:Transcript_35065/g.88236  ORF Transcript_35065/g.88236 Transcript_35065/m.88236 type:complete len:404 (-) Transcript_35065:113-1324(-)
MLPGWRQQLLEGLLVAVQAWSDATEQRRVARREHDERYEQEQEQERGAAGEALTAQAYSGRRSAGELCAGERGGAGQTGIATEQQRWHHLHRRGEDRLGDGALHSDGALPGGHHAAVAGSARPLGQPGRHLRHRGADYAGPGAHPRAPRGAPRPQAGQHPHRPERPRQDRRLWVGHLALRGRHRRAGTPDWRARHRKVPARGAGARGADHRPGHTPVRGTRAAERRQALHAEGGHLGAGHGVRRAGHAGVQLPDGAPRGTARTAQAADPRAAAARRPRAVGAAARPARSGSGPSAHRRTGARASAHRAARREPHPAQLERQCGFVCARQSRLAAAAAAAAARARGQFLPQANAANARQQYTANARQQYTAAGGSTGSRRRAQALSTADRDHHRGQRSTFDQNR